MIRYATVLLSILIIVSNAFSGTVVLPPSEDSFQPQDLTDVGAIYNSTKPISGSGVLLWTGEHVITAKHVVADNNKLYHPKHLSFFLDGKSHSVDRVYALQYHDLAILKLKTKLDGGYEIYRPDALGLEIVGAGYGRGSSDPSYTKIEWDLPDGEKRVFFNVIEGNTLGTYIFDVDYPNSLGKPWGAVDGEGFPGFGDSGGGIFVLDDGQLKLAGVVSKITNNYPYVAFAVNASTFTDWVEEVVDGSFDKIVDKTASMDRVNLGFAVIAFLLLFLAASAVLDMRDKKDK